MLISYVTFTIDSCLDVIKIFFVILVLKVGKSLLEEVYKR